MTTMQAELQCRRMVRLLPRWYRADREDEMVGTLLDVRSAGGGRFAEWRELAAMAGLGLRARLAAGHAPARVVALGDTVRLLALLGVFWGAMKSLLTVGHVVSNAVFHPQWDNDFAGDLGLAAAVIVPVGLLLEGKRRAARISAGFMLAAGFAVFLWRYSFSFNPALLGYFVPQWLPLLLVIVGFHDGAPLAHARKWGTALAAAAGSAFVFGFFADLELRGLSWFAWVAALVIPGYLVWRRSAERPAAWSFSLAACCALVLIQPLVLRATMVSEFEPVELVQLSLVGTGIALLVGIGIRDYRRGLARG
ncbi:hypothetical protein [Amycolatopsis jejuensis]|uniref:hypothetical protein n=1 Tax=Amycolatopsis jejuensis TaxID=330084 RepID=UPI00068DA60C|nr:hypothetical protein [Amycolatopsis jejuensis]